MAGYSEDYLLYKCSTRITCCLYYIRLYDVLELNKRCTRVMPKTYQNRSYLVLQLTA